MGKEKKDKLRQKIKLLEKVANKFIGEIERLEKEKIPVGKRIKKPPSDKQKAVQSKFGNRARVASLIYNAPGNTLSWGEAMKAAGPLMDAQEREGGVVDIQHLANLTVLPEETTEESKPV